VRLLAGVEGAKRLGLALTTGGLGADFVVDVRRQIIETVGAVLPGDEGDDGQASGIFKIDDCVGDDVILFIENVAG
jgi:hypothetical protein